MVTLAPTTSNDVALRPRVEILGVFGSGKSTLAARIAERPDDFLAERHEQNPYWGDTRALAVSGYLPYDLAFLIQHAHLAGQSSDRSYAPAICDWSLATDHLWAAMRLGEDLAIYDKVFEAVRRRIGEAIGYLYLKHTADIIAQRITERGRAPEAYVIRDVERAAQRLDQLVEALPPDKVVLVDDDLPVDTYRRHLSRWID